MSARRAELAFVAYQAKGGEGSKMPQDDLGGVSTGAGFKKSKCKGVPPRCKGVLSGSGSRMQAISEGLSGDGGRNG
jgi:hypothetical protein